jgi:phage/plasmid primase-like uncharacterized protein
MSDFISFCRSLGLMINEYPPFGRWCRYSTEDHPSKKNGAVKYLGDVGWAQNHSLMSEPATWFPDSSDDIRIDAEAVRQRCEKAARELHEGRQKAASRATDMLRQCSLERHAYLDGKGFSDERGNVLALESGPLLLIPMRVAGRLVGVQTITTDGEKKFLFGQQCSGAEYVIDNKGRDFFCEGYATGLSVRAALSALKMRYRVHVCFSAHNLTKLAGACPGGLVIADNDSSGAGLRAAQQSGLKFFIPPTVGHDFNDMHKSLGVFKLSQMIRKFMMDTS